MKRDYNDLPDGWVSAKSGLGSGSRQVVRPFAGASVVIGLVGVAVLIFVFWPLGLLLMLGAGLLDRRQWVCSRCGNRVEKTSMMCPACGSRLTGES